MIDVYLMTGARREASLGSSHMLSKSLSLSARLKSIDQNFIEKKKQQENEKFCYQLCVRAQMAEKVT